MFLEEAREKKEDALALRKQMGDAFVPFVYELTYEQTYSIWGYLSFVSHKYVNLGGVHPTKTMESRTYHTNNNVELSVSELLMEDQLDVSLVKFVTDLFVDKLKEIAPESADIYTYDYVNEYLGYVQFYITHNSMVLYFNQGELAPYALGVISVEIPFDTGLFYVDSRNNYEAEHLIECEYDKEYEWRIFDYSKDKLEVTEKYTDYPPEEIFSEYYPVGLFTANVKGIKKGNADLVLAHVEKGKGLESAIQILLYRFSVDENNMLSLIINDEAWFLINK